MASRSLGEFLLRPSNLTRLPQTSRRITPSWTCQRAVSDTPRRLAQPLRKDDDEHYVREQQAQRPQARYVPERAAAAPQPQPRPTTQYDATRTIDSLFSNMPASKAPYMPQDTPSSSKIGRVFGAEFASTGSMRPNRKPSLSFDEMTLPASDLAPSLANKPSNMASLAAKQEEILAQYPHLNPSYGRTIDLDASRGRDIVRGIGMLGSLMARNKVKSDFNKQKFHERGGLKRKRLASERWRARFQKGFRDLTYRVTELTRKGW